MHQQTPSPNTGLISQLNINSEPYHDPLSHLDWSKLNLDDYWLPPSQISLSGLPEFEQLDETLKRRLSQYEFVHVIQTGLWLESMFIVRLGKSLGRPLSSEVHTFNLHEIREEAGHSLMFLKLMQTSGLHIPTYCITRPAWMDWLGRHWPEDSLLFWLTVVIGEDLPDRLNRQIRAQHKQVNPLIAQMCRSHIIDEARHIARARRELDSRLSRTSRGTRIILAPIVQMMLDQFVRKIYLPHHGIYELAGLSPGSIWQKKAAANPRLLARLEQDLRPVMSLLAQHGITLRLTKLAP